MTSNDVQAMTEENKQPEHPIFRDLQADDDIPEIIEIESLCMQCKENGVTRLLLTKIPFYKEVVIMSFHCDHCGWENNELQPAAKIQEQGVNYSLKVLSIKDLTRQVVKTESASIQIPEIQFEVPANTQEAAITTVEGVIQRAVNGISLKYEEIKFSDPATAERISTVINKLKDMGEAKQTYTFILDDPSGNSFVENFCAPKMDPQLDVSHYNRTPEQDQALGIFSSSNDDGASHEKDKRAEDKLQDEVLQFQTNCPSCNVPCETNMKVTNIPNFKSVVIMATNCDVCGHRTNEVKSGSGIEPKGTRIKLKITKTSDLCRDLLKSETCSVLIPDLELEVGGAILGGRFTTVEGLLMNIGEELIKENPLATGDSAHKEIKARMGMFLDKLNEIISGSTQATLILDDPCGNSYIQNAYAPDSDPFLEIVTYERTFEQNEELGLNDMKTENYST